MNSSIRLIPALILGLFLIGSIQSNEAEDLGEEEAGVTMVLTKFDVNDTSLELS